MAYTQNNPFSKKLNTPLLDAGHGGAKTHNHEGTKLETTGTQKSNRTKDYDTKGWANENRIAQEDLKLSKEALNQKEWFSEYINSPKYLERLGKEFPSYLKHDLNKEKNRKSTSKEKE